MTTDPQSPRAPALPDARIQDRRFDPRVGADDQKGVGLFDAFNGGIEQIAGAPELRIELVACLPAIEILGTQTREQIFERKHFLGARKIARNAADRSTAPPP